MPRLTDDLRFHGCDSSVRLGVDVFKCSSGLLTHLVEFFCEERLEIVLQLGFLVDSFVMFMHFSVNALYDPLD